MTDEIEGRKRQWLSVGFWLGSELARQSVCFMPLRRGARLGKVSPKTARERAEYLKHKSKAAAAQVNSYVDAGKEQFGDYVERGKQAVDRGRSQVETYVDRGRKVVAKHAEKVSAAVDAGKNAYTATTSPVDGKSRGSGPGFRRTGKNKWINSRRLY